MFKAQSSQQTLEFCHYTFDFAQNVNIPYHGRQVGPLHFKSPLKIQIFGICNDATNTQMNYLFSESQSIGTNGTKAHGPNSVISMLHHYFSTHSSHQESCQLHADSEIVWDNYHMIHLFSLPFHLS